MSNANYLSRYIIFLKIHIVNLRKWYTCFNLIQTYIVFWYKVKMKIFSKKNIAWNYLRNLQLSDVLSFLGHPVLVHKYFHEKFSDIFPENIRTRTVNKRIWILLSRPNFSRKIRKKIFFHQLSTIELYFFYNLKEI